jgi:hypothetical protein
LVVAVDLQTELRMLVLLRLRDVQEEGEGEGVREALEP